MRLALLSSIFFYSILSLGLTTISGRNEALKYDSNTPLRVLLDKGQQELNIKSILNTVFVKEDGAANWKKYLGSVRVRLSQNKRTIWINGDPFKNSIIYVRGGTQHTDPLQYGINLYRGALKITNTKNGLLMTNIIPLEEYLYGMVAAEMSHQSELEALKAQVVPPRTYAM